MRPLVFSFKPWQRWSSTIARYLKPIHRPLECLYSCRRGKLNTNLNYEEMSLIESKSSSSLGQVFGFLKLSFSMIPVLLSKPRILAAVFQGQNLAVHKSHNLNLGEYRPYRYRRYGLVSQIYCILLYLFMTSKDLCWMQCSVEVHNSLSIWP